MAFDENKPPHTPESTPRQGAQEVSPQAPTKRNARAALQEELSPEMVAAQHAFFEARVHHPRLDECLADLLPLLVPHSESNIIVITGAPGAGKSTLTRSLLGRLVKQFAALTDADTTSIPMVAVEAYSNGDTKHSFKGLFQSLAEQLQEPAMEAKAPADLTGGKLRVQPYAKYTVDGLRRAVQDGLKARKTRVAVVDEAAHLLRFGKQAAVMDTLKSLSNTAGGVKWVLVGSYDLFDLLIEGGQIARRSAILNLGRYHVNSDSDRVHFKDIVRKLQAKWPCPDAIPNFVAVSDELMEASLGCIGLLKSLMLDASAMQLRNGGVWKGVYLRQAAKSVKMRKAIAQEIEAGEQKIKDALHGNSMWDGDTFSKMLHKMEAK